MFDSMFGVMFMAAGAYCLYAAFKGSGMAYNNNYPPEIKEEANKHLRKYLWIFGPILLAQGFIDYKGLTEDYPFLYFIFLGLTVAIFVVFFVTFRKKFGKALSKKKEINKPL